MRLIAVPTLVFALSLSPASAAALPASYSLNDHRMVVGIKDQGDLGTCWSFSSSTVFEYSLIKGGLLSSRRAGNLISEWDMAIHAGTKLSLAAPYNGWGSDPRNAIGYLTRGFGHWNVKGISEPAGSGPVARNADRRNAYPLAAAEQGRNLRPYLPPGSQAPVPFRLVQALEFVSTTGPGLPPTPGFREKIKQAILDYGALDTNMNAYDLSHGINKTYDTYAYTGPSPATDHDVTVIGWNDNVPVYDRHGKLLGVGAWLIQNSWGTDFGNSPLAVPKPAGCFWLGYMDTVAIKYCAAMVTERRGATSPTVLQNQIFGFQGVQAGSAKGARTLAATRLIPQSDSGLVALGLWTVADRAAVDIAIYSAWSAQGPRGTLLATVRNILIPQRGYNEIPLRAPLALMAGRAIYVVVDFGTRADKPIAVDTVSLRLKGRDNFADLSWESNDGAYWRDIAQRKSGRGIFFLKGIQGGTATPHKGAVLSVTGLAGPLVTTGSSITLRGTASVNTRRIFYRLGESGSIRSVRARGRSAWKITVNGLRAGRNVAYIWPAAARGVATSPLKVTVRRD